MAGHEGVFVGIQPVDIGVNGEADYSHEVERIMRLVEAYFKLYVPSGSVSDIKKGDRVVDGFVNIEGLEGSQIVQMDIGEIIEGVLTGQTFIPERPGEEGLQRAVFGLTPQQVIELNKDPDFAFGRLWQEAEVDDTGFVQYLPYGGDASESRGLFENRRDDRAIEVLDAGLAERIVRMFSNELVRDGGRRYQSEAGRKEIREDVLKNTRVYLVYPRMIEFSQTSIREMEALKNPA